MSYKNNIKKVSNLVKILNIN